MSTCGLRGRRRTIASLIAAVAFFLAICAASGHHTDDGCQVELHCFACLWALAGKVDLALPVPEAPAPLVTIHLRAAEPPGPDEGVAPRLESRGPPTSA